MNPLLFPTFLFPSSHGNHAKLPCRYPTQQATQIMVMDQQCHHRHHHNYSVLRRMANDPFYGLTDDGDFAILGVNVEETTDDANKSDGQVIGSDLSYNIMSATSFSGISSDDLKIPTAQSTGASMDSQTAVAGAGIGMGDVMLLNDTLFGRLPPNDMVASNTNHATDKSNSRPLEGSALGSNSGKSKYSEIINNTNNDIDEKSLKAWLLTEIPKLNQNDIEAYSRGLSKIGFHPECVTMCELKYEDLDFMKVLHQRYMFNEITGIDHPCEV